MIPAKPHATARILPAWEWASLRGTQSKHCICARSYRSSWVQHASIRPYSRGTGQPQGTQPFVTSATRLTFRCRCLLRVPQHFPPLQGLSTACQSSSGWSQETNQRQQVMPSASTNSSFLQKLTPCPSEASSKIASAGKYQLPPSMSFD